MEEKKLTDEEIIHDLEKFASNSDMNETGIYAEILDLIHRLQNKIKEQDKEYIELDLECRDLRTENEELKSPKFASWKLKFFNLKEEFDKKLAEHEEFAKEAKAEIERLTEEKNSLNEARCLDSKVYVDLVSERNELQKQVDELKNENKELYKEHTTLIAGSILKQQDIVKDTAKEILIPLIECEKQIDPLQTGIRWSVLKGFCKKFGIEVKDNESTL